MKDSDVVEFIATGVLDCAPSHSSKYKKEAIVGAVLIKEVCSRDLNLDDSDFCSRVDDIRKASQTEGFKVIAWFKPYHVWTEETWGIYINARKLDDLAQVDTRNGPGRINARSFCRRETQ